MQQQSCNISNYQRMHTQAGEQASKEAEKLAEDMLGMIINLEPGVHGAVVAATAVAMVRGYLRKGLTWGISPEAVKSMEQLEELFDADYWMTMHNDRVALDVEHFVADEMEGIRYLKKWRKN